MGSKRQPTLAALAIWNPRNDEVALLAGDSIEGIELYYVQTLSAPAALTEIRKYIARGGTRNHFPVGPPVQASPAAMEQAG